MANWKAKLYEGYVSTKQSAAASREAVGLSLSRYPQYQNIISRHLPSDRSINVADLGCGDGSLIFCLKTLGYKNVHGVDVSSEQVEVAQKLGVVEVQQGDLLVFLKEKTQTYDVIFLMDILEHLEKQEVFDLLGSAKKALTNRGRVIIHVPNAEGVFGMRIRYGDFTHQVCFTPQSIRQVLRATGFENISVYEEKPLVHGAISLVRRVLWSLLTARERLLLLAETGAGGHVLSQNMLVVAE